MKVEDNQWEQKESPVVGAESGGIEEGKDKGGKKIYLPTKLSLTIRLMVAAYLLYIVYSLRDVTQKYSGSELVFFLVAIAAFVVIGVLLIIHSARALAMGKYVGGAMDREDNDE
ncbi:hypothetical protein [Kineothrix sp. MB12-C1]|uniref:hypothetical protein n=1 Tax=Kineothrix sp. MB12-C1 TaxID=3070215 RepID=UPI0027D33330|nr:hypothetical protein [Kineothrix sp. MB12-C1]WMC94262.1 hypothetical protein RBB56_08395 [Kineothrix sp. MB12-C1]